MARAREAKLARFELRRGLEPGPDEHPGDLVASGRLDAEVGNWLAQLQAAQGLDDTYSFYCDGELVWRVKPDDDEGAEAGGVVNAKGSVTPRDLDSIDTVLAERQHEVDRLTVKAGSLEQQVVNSEARLRQIQEDTAGKQLDLQQARERHVRELAALDADLERRRQLDAHERVRMANELEKAMRMHQAELEAAVRLYQAERTRMAAEIEASTQSYQTQCAVLSATVGDQVKAVRSQVAELQGLGKDIRQIASEEAAAAAASKASATSATVEQLEALNELQEAAAENLRPEKPDAGKTEVYQAVGNFIKKDLAGVVINLAGMFAPGRRRPAEDDDDEDTDVNA